MSVIYAVLPFVSMLVVLIVIHELGHLLHGEGLRHQGPRSRYRLPAARVGIRVARDNLLDQLAPARRLRAPSRRRRPVGPAKPRCAARLEAPDRALRRLWDEHHPADFPLCGRLHDPARRAARPRAHRSRGAGFAGRGGRDHGRATRSWSSKDARSRTPATPGASSASIWARRSISRSGGRPPAAASRSSSSRSRRAGTRPPTRDPTGIRIANRAQTIPQCATFEDPPPECRPTESESYNPIAALGKGWTSTWDSLILARNQIIGLFYGGQGPDVAGPVGIAQATGEVVEESGWQTLLDFAALLSINLAIINVLPLPMLDGGRIAFVVPRGHPRRQAHRPRERGDRPPRRPRADPHDGRRRDLLRHPAPHRRRLPLRVTDDITKTQRLA